MLEKARMFDSSQNLNTQIGLSLECYTFPNKVTFQNTIVTVYAAVARIVVVASKGFNFQKREEVEWTRDRRR